MAWCENLIQAAGMKPGERVLVVVDEPLIEEGAELADAAKDAGGEPRLELWAGERPLSAAPPRVIEGGREADVSFFMAQAPRGDEANARFELAESVIGHGGRQIFMGFVDGDLLRGELSEPPPDLADAARGLIAQVEGAETIRIRGKAGTDLTLKVAGRPWLTDAAGARARPDGELPGRRDLRRARTATAPTASSSPT